MTLATAAEQAGIGLCITVSTEPNRRPNFSWGQIRAETILTSRSSVVASALQQPGKLSLIALPCCSRSILLSYGFPTRHASSILLRPLYHPRILFVFVVVFFGESLLPNQSVNQSKPRFPISQISTTFMQCQATPFEVLQGALRDAEPYQTFHPARQPPLVQARPFLALYSNKP